MWTWKLRIAVVVACVTFAAGSLLYVYNKGRQSGMSAIQTKWDQEKLATAQAHAQELEKARTREQVLQAQAAQLREDHRRETDRIAAAHRATVDGLRDRPEARAGAAGVPDTAGAGATAGWCTGTRLYRDHAEVLAGEAARAAELQAALKQCRAAYNAIREANEKPNQRGAP